MAYVKGRGRAGKQSGLGAGSLTEIPRPEQQELPFTEEGGSWHSEIFFFCIYRANIIREYLSPFPYGPHSMFYPARSYFFRPCLWISSFLKASKLKSG